MNRIIGLLFLGLFFGGLAGAKVYDPASVQIKSNNLLHKGAKILVLRNTRINTADGRLSAVVVADQGVISFQYASIAITKGNKFRPGHGGELSADVTPGGAVGMKVTHGRF